MRMWWGGGRMGGRRGEEEIFVVGREVFRHEMDMR